MGHLVHIEPLWCFDVPCSGVRRRLSLVIKASIPISIADTDVTATGLQGEACYLAGVTVGNVIRGRLIRPQSDSQSSRSTTCAKCNRPQWLNDSKNSHVRKHVRRKSELWPTSIYLYWIVPVTMTEAKVNIRTSLNAVATCLIRLRSALCRIVTFIWPNNGNCIKMYQHCIHIFVEISLCAETFHEIDHIVTDLRCRCS